MDDNVAVMVTNSPTGTMADLWDAAGRVFSRLDIREETRKDYKYRIGLFIKFIEKNGYSRNSFLDFKRELAGRVDFSVSTKNKYLTTARIFLKELNREGVIPVDITHNTKSFQQNKKHKRDGLNDDEMGILTNKIQSFAVTPSTTRIKAIFTLLALQGLRQIEIIRLDVKDLDFVGKTAFVQGKGQDDKDPVSLQPETCKALQEYLKVNKISDGALFTSNSNNSLRQRLTTRALRGIVRAILAQLGINKSTHGFRHYFTTKLIKAYKGDILEVARYTRHKSIDMLQVYNDNIKMKADLPRFYETFNEVRF